MGATALHRACGNACNKVVDSLLLAGATANLADLVRVIFHGVVGFPLADSMLAQMGDSPLHIACLEGQKIMGASWIVRHHASNDFDATVALLLQRLTQTDVNAHSEVCHSLQRSCSEKSPLMISMTRCFAAWPDRSCKRSMRGVGGEGSAPLGCKRRRQPSRSIGWRVRVQSTVRGSRTQA